MQYGARYRLVKGRLLRNSIHTDYLARQQGAREKGVPEGGPLTLPT